MTDFWQQAIPIFIMYGIVLALGPFIGFALWLCYTGDQAREQAAAQRVAARTGAEPVPTAPQLAAVRDDATAALHRGITAAIGAA